jgi:YidC/Oxa1 family membrane protein insertase
VDKRFLHALFFCLLFMFAWAFLFGPPREQPKGSGGTAPESGAPASGPVGESGAGDGPAADELPPPRTEVVAAESEQELALYLSRRTGAPGDRYWARFTNRGAELLELRDENWPRQRDVAHTLLGGSGHGHEDWVPLLVSVDTGAGRTGSLAWRTEESSRRLVRAPLDEALWTMEELTGDDGQPLGVLFRYAPGTGVVFTKRVTVIPGTHRLRVVLGLENVDAGPAEELLFTFTPAECVPPELEDNFYQEPKAVAAGPLTLGEGKSQPELDTAERSDKAERAHGSLDARGPLAYAGALNKYFAVLLHGGDDEATASLLDARYRRIADPEWGAANGRTLAQSLRYTVADVVLQLFLPEPGETRTWSYELYAGPKKPEIFLEDDPHHELILDKDLSWFAGIGKFLLALLKLLQRVTHNWGVAIIVLTLGIRGLLFPLNRRSQTSMARYQKKMKRVQPKLEEIKKKYEKDPQALRREQARIMQEEKAFPPLGGCLPIFIQLPIFFGLFSALRTSFDLRQATFFGWIDDLSRPDRMFRMFETDVVLPLVGSVQYFNLLPPLMVVLWILQQRTMPKPADEQQARVQKMMMFMPVVMGVFLYNYAAGLSLYMITTASMSILEHGFIKKRWPVKDDEPEKKKPGCGPFSGILQNLADKQAEHMKRVQAMQKSGATKKKAGKRKR